MRRAVEQLTGRCDHLLIDAIKINVDLPQTPLIHGDALSFSIAAASILAKVGRDHALASWDQVFPEFRLGQNKGYGTAKHLAALDQLLAPPHSTASALNRCASFRDSRLGPDIRRSRISLPRISTRRLCRTRASCSHVPKSRARRRGRLLSSPVPPKDAKLGWQRRLLRISLALFTFEVGAFLVIFPWMDESWDINYFQSLTPGIQSLWSQPSFRGALTGLGFVNIYIACLQVVHAFRRS